MGAILFGVGALVIFLIPVGMKSVLMSPDG